VPSALGAPSAIRPWLSHGATTTRPLLRIRLTFPLSGAVKANNSPPSTTNHNAVATPRPSRRNVVRLTLRLWPIICSMTVMASAWAVCRAEVGAAEPLYG
jgi:hypothetical protein